MVRRKASLAALTLPDDLLRSVLRHATSKAVGDGKIAIDEAWLTIKCAINIDRQHRRLTIELLEDAMPLSPAQFDLWLRMAFGKGDVCALGSAGTGKSFTAKLAIRALRGMGTMVQAVAPTKRTAEALDGHTVAKFIGLRPHVMMTRRFHHSELFVNNIHSPDYLANRFGLCHGMQTLARSASVLDSPEETKKVDYDEVDYDEDDKQKEESWIAKFMCWKVADEDVVVLDEVFMMSCFRFEQFVAITRMYCTANVRPMPRFILIGDPWQTEPFSTDANEIRVCDGTFAFETPTFKCRFPNLRNVFELRSVKRSNEPEFHRLLANLRNNSPITDADVAQWHALTAQPSYGARMSAALPLSADGQPVSVALMGRRVPPKWDPSVPAISEFNILVRGSNEFEFIDLVAIDRPASNGRVPTRFPRTIRVARGVVVAFLNDIDGKEVHAHVTGLHDDSITVRGFDGKRISIRRVATSEVYLCSPQPEGTRTQFPIKVVGGLTTHSTQGLTLRFPHAVFVESSALWSRNMVFTALSRSTEMRLITLCGSMSEISNRVHSALLAFQEQLDGRMKCVRE